MEDVCVLSRLSRPADDGRTCIIGVVVWWHKLSCSDIFPGTDRRLIFVQIWMNACLRWRHEGAYIAALVRVYVPICEVAQIAL